MGIEDILAPTHSFEKILNMLRANMVKKKMTSCTGIDF
jgi:hypothetical protein